MSPNGIGNFNLFIFGSFVFFVTLSPAVRAVAKETSPSPEMVICKNKKIVRTLRIFVEDGHCQAIYTKNGKEQVIGSGIHLVSCQNYSDGVKKNLVDSGWKCRDVKESTMSDMSENQEPTKQ